MTLHHRRGPARGLLVCVAALALFTGACGTAGGAERAGNDALKIAATTTVIGDVVGNVAPGTAEVSVLMAPGTDPHTFEPSARQLAELQEVDLVVANGGGLEESLQVALDDAASAGVPVFSALEHVTPLEAEHEGGEDHDASRGDDAPSEHGQARPSAGDDAHGDDAQDHGGDETATTDGNGHDHGGVDPHFWMDPVRMAEVVDALGTQIGELTGAPRRSADRAQRYATELRDLHRRIVALFDDLPQDRRTIVTNHEALAYFADRYDLRIAGTVIPGMTTGAEPSAADIEQLAAELRRAGLTTILTDSTAPAQLARTLAGEVGADTEIVELYTESLGGEEGGPQSYVDMLMIDAERISEALGR